MGLFSTIYDAMQAAPKIANSLNRGISRTQISNKSLIKRANESTFQLPFIVPDTTPVDMATALSRMMDRVYAGYVQIALGNESTMNLSYDRTPMQFMKKFHQNMKFESAIEKLAVPEEERELYMEKVYTGEYALYSDPSKRYFVLFNQANKGLMNILESNREYLKPYLYDIKLQAPDDGEEMYEADTDDIDLAQVAITGQLRAASAKARNQELSAIAGIARESKGPQLTDGDTKRINDMMPYAIQVRLSVVNDEDEFVQYMDCVVGVKTILHLVKSEDMIKNIEMALQNRSGFFRFLRWTTGEISFFKDLVLKLDDIKFDASNQNSGKSPLFGNLKRMKRRGIGFNGGSVHSLLPNATMCVTSYETQYMETKYGIKLGEESTAKKLMQAMNLMTLIIADDATGTVNILYDGDATFQTYALESIEREVSLSSNKLGKEIGRMISH